VVHCPCNRRCLSRQYLTTKAWRRCFVAPSIAVMQEMSRFFVPLVKSLNSFLQAPVQTYPAKRTISSRLLSLNKNNRCSSPRPKYVIGCKSHKSLFCRADKAQCFLCNQCWVNSGLTRSFYPGVICCHPYQVTFFYLVNLRWLILVKKKLVYPPSASAQIKRNVTGRVLLSNSKKLSSSLWLNDASIPLGL